MTDWAYGGVLHGNLVVASAHVLGGFIMKNTWTGCHNGANVLGRGDLVKR